jgi:hypothetical protein
MGTMHLRALRNGAIAAVITAVVGFGLNALFAAADSGGTVATPPPTTSPTPACVPTADTLPRTSVAAVAGRFSDIWRARPNDAWAVGSAGTSDTESTPVLAHWDGTSWAPERGVPTVGTTEALDAVDGSRPADVWAVGWSSDGLGKDTLALHYDGTSWTTADSPTNATLFDVRALGRNDVWAVGSSGDPDFVDETALALHWNGSSWTPAKLDVRGGRSGLSAIAGEDGDLWAVGYHHNGPLVLHYDGSNWTRVDVNARGPLRSVAVDNGTVWLGGSMLLRGDGTTFDRVGKARTGVTFADIAPVSETQAIAVGSVVTADATRSVALEVDGGVSHPVRLKAPGDDALEAVALGPKDVLTVGWHAVGKRDAPLVATVVPC